MQLLLWIFMLFLAIRLFPELFLILLLFMAVKLMGFLSPKERF